MEDDFSSWTSCEMYGHDFDDETSNCRDCGEGTDQGED
jgi:hypothetical protein